MTRVCGPTTRRVHQGLNAQALGRMEYEVHGLQLLPVAGEPLNAYTWTYNAAYVTPRYAVRVRPDLLTESARGAITAWRADPRRARALRAFARAHLWQRKCSRPSLDPGPMRERRACPRPRAEPEISFGDPDCCGSRGASDLECYSARATV